jgi:5-methylcytosine-specific restriction endonuclease McrA
MSWIRKKKRRHRELWRTGQVKLSGHEMGELRLKVYERSNGRCERIIEGNRCNKPAPWDGWKHGELRHGLWRSQGGSDSSDNCEFWCADCHHDEHKRGRKMPIEARSPTPAIGPTAFHGGREIPDGID